MQKIDISDYKREEIYYSDSAHKILNEELIFQLSGENFLIYKQNLIDSYKLNLFQDIKIEKQKTGFWVILPQLDVLPIYPKGFHRSQDI